MEENQEFMVLKKRLNTYKSSKGGLIGLPSELIVDIVKSWERWTGSPKSFYQAIGIKGAQLAFIIKKGKRLFKEGKENLGPFTPLEIKSPNSCKIPMVLKWDKDKSIRFYEVEHLIEFLKKAA